MSLEPELYGVNERTAAMIMAIVADEMAVPVEELDFKYIREVEYMKFRVTLNGKTYEVEAEKGAPMPETVHRLSKCLLLRRLRLRLHPLPFPARSCPRRCQEMCWR